MCGTKRNGLKRMKVVIVKYNDGEIKCLGPRRKGLKGKLVLIVKYDDREIKCFGPNRVVLIAD